MNNIVCDNKAKVLLEAVLGPDSTFCYNRCGINVKLKNTRKTQAIFCKDFLLACLRLVSVPFAVYEFLSGNICGNYNTYY